MTNIGDEIRKIEEKAAADIASAKAIAARKLELAAERKRQNEEAARTADQLRLRLERENGVQRNSKRDLLWSIAWERGHSSGLSDVEFNYNELVELIK